jgi:RimJ/RimL family protein N-acetyltransferase
VEAPGSYLHKARERILMSTQQLEHPDCTEYLPIKLIPMTDEQYQSFMKISFADQVQNQILAGLLEPGQASDTVAAQQKQMLPQGVCTPNQYFFAIQSTASGEQVGGIWFTTMKRRGKEYGFIMDIQIDPKHRRHGYGSAAFVAIERFALAKGLGEIGLNVFGHNTPARALYQKLGYREVGVSMTKSIGPQ